MANLQYGDTFQLQCQLTQNYLAIDKSEAAVTTLTALATWKFESPEGKTGTVNIGDTVRIVNTGPTSSYPSPSYLKGAAESASIEAYSGTVSKDDKSLLWTIYALETGVNQFDLSGPVSEDSYICLSCELAQAKATTPGYATGAFVYAHDRASGTIDGVLEVNQVGTRKLLDVGNGPDTWWKVVNASLLEKGGTPTPAPSPSHNPFHPGPVLGGGGSGPNSLCDDLPTIMKSICSLTVLMHKVVDACYPQSSWPTQPYPDGCGSGHKHKGDCGCKDKQKGGSEQTQEKS